MSCMQASRVLIRKASHVSSSSACCVGRPLSRYRIRALHTSVHAASPPVSSEHSLMCERITCSTGKFTGIVASCLCRSSQLMYASSPSHSATHGRSPRVWPTVVCTSSQST